MKTTRTVIALGNGQLGLMLGKAAKILGIPFNALSLSEAWAWLNVKGKENVLVTFEQEHVDEKLLLAIKEAGLTSFPSWEAFSLLRSKKQQKEFLSKNKIPTAVFRDAQIWNGEIAAFAPGKVLKAGKGGYDGKGVWLIDANGQTKQGPVKELLSRIEEPYIEEKIAFDFELAAVVCRSACGEIELYPTVKSIQREGICYQVEYSEDFAKTQIAQRAGFFAKKIAEELHYVGVLAVEFFAKGEDILVNEIAPRVHNSGHFTIDVCAGSQFENHLRAGIGLPLLPTHPTHPAALMVNLLWPEKEKEFAPLFARLTCGPDWPENVKFHWYGKSEARPRRKMGHFTVYGNSLAECHKTADQILASRWA